MIAIHDRYGSYSTKWIEYCEANKIDFTIVDVFSNNILDTLRRIKATYLFFHFGTGEYKTDLVLKKLCYVLEKEGVKVFPKYSDFWHYDDKLSQKYLFEQLNIPHAPMKVFYSKESATEWVENQGSLPFVFKLRGGAGSKNVKLVENKKQARKLIKKMFGRGIKPIRSVLVDTGPAIRRHRQKKDWGKVLLRAPKTLYNNLLANQMLPAEKGYFLTQTFYPDNEYDTRVTVIGDKAFGFRRHVRPNDFRASGSGLIDYDPKKIDSEMISIAFEASEKLDSTSAAFDFIYDCDNSPKILEVSYCYVPELIFNTAGYWDKNLNYHKEKIRPEHEIMKVMLS